MYLYVKFIFKQQKYCLQQEMSATENKLRSKYDSSSRKIKELYQEFSAMKKNIYTPTKKNNGDSSFMSSASKKQRREYFNQSIDLSVNRLINNVQSRHQEHPSTFSFQIQTYIKNACLKNLTCLFVGMDKKMDSRVTLMEERLNNLKVLFQQVAIFLKFKSQRLKQNKVNNHQDLNIQNIVKQVQQKYDKKIKQFVANYENKISLLVKQAHTQDTSDSSNAKKTSRQLEDECHKLQDKLIIKEQQITSLKLANSRLRRTIDQNSLLMAEKEALVNQLHKQIQDKQSKLMEMAKLKIQKIVSVEKDCSICEQLNSQIKNLKENIQKLKIQNSQLLKQCNKLKSTELPLQNIPIDTIKNKSQWNQSEIGHQIVMVHSDEEDGDIFTNNLNIKQENYQPLRHTQYFHPNERKDSYKYEKKIKQMESELQLLTEQNNLLKAKKDKFEQQCKENQDDEQKFQMQSQILREQLKNVTVSLKLLDECAVSYLKQKKVNEQTVDKLKDEIKFKQEYFKKFPKKKVKSNSKI